ncbi:MAG: hypothetical protein JWO36_4256 [Myxococcales bacterium]|nr:hypothetical protein [Myxococcales bacterium]
MNRDAKTQSALLALARTRRMQRALAHAYIHRDAPMPTLRLSLGFMTSTVCTTDDVATTAPASSHRMSVLGVSNSEGIAYVVEELGSGEAPIAYRLFLRGARQGHLVPIHAWYEERDHETEIRARIASVAATLEPVTKTTAEAWMLSTRIVQRRALRVAGQISPIRKYALQLRVEPVSGHGASGHTTVTAFLQPGATLGEVWGLPDGGAIARVTFTGIPSGLGLSKDTVILLTE